MSKEIGLEILRQLGGNKFRVMTGAKDFVALENGLMFGLPFPKINKVRITLNAADLYNIEFMRIRKVKGVPTVKPVADYYNIYADKLVEMFERETGLATHL